MSKVLKIYCEGKAGSSDFDIISKVIDGFPVIVSPVGGKKGAKSAIQVHENGTSKSDYKLFFRDRDFDIPVPDNEQLTSDGSYVYYSYRTTIENYLIDYKLIETYSKGKSWYSSELENSFHDAAKKIKYFQAARHTLGKLRVPTDFGSNIVEKSGILPNDFTEKYCKEEGYKKILESLGKTKNWSKKNYDSTFDNFVNFFSDRFIESNDFLIYFQGKDFMSSLCKELPGFSPKDYYKYAKANFDYQNFGDLIELRKMIEAEL